MENSLAPIVLFVFNRPAHTRQTLSALSKNLLASDSELYVYADGPKTGSSEQEMNSISEVRKIISEIQFCKKLHICESPTNLGLANSVIKGVSEVVSKHGKVIVLEDDLVTSIHFLRYMNDSLNHYEDCLPIVCISGYSFPVLRFLRFRNRTIFLRTGATWGWATWSRGWRTFRNDAEGMLKEIDSSGQTEIFNFNNCMNYNSMLRSQAEKKIDSWGICWYASIFLSGQFTVYSPKSLVKNIGMDGSGTHYKTGKKHLVPESVLFSENRDEFHIQFSSCPKAESWVGRKLLELGFRFNR